MRERLYLSWSSRPTPLRRPWRIWAAACAIAAVLAGTPAAGADVLTYHDDNARTGGQLDETELSPATVNAARFGKLYSQTVDGAVYAQPLVSSRVSIAGRGATDVVFVATEHDSVYAFDADGEPGSNAGPLWHHSFLDNPPIGVTVTPIPAADVATDDLAPEIGITSTPVIDPASGTLYVEAATKEVSGTLTRYVQRLHALDLATGAEKLGRPVEISAVANGTGSGADASARIAFDPRWEFNRAALLLSRGVVFVAFASHADALPSHGWVLGYDAATLSQVAVFNTTPDGILGTIWMSGGGPAADQAGNVFVVTGNGTFDFAGGGRDLADSFLKLTPDAGGLALADYFTPFNQDVLAASDLDLGSGGVVLLPDRPAGKVPLAVGAGKDGTIYLLDRDRLGGYTPTGDAVIQEVQGILNGSFCTPAVLGDTVYIGSSNYDGGSLLAFDLSSGVLSSSPTSEASEYFPFPGVNPSVSADGSSDGIVWVIEHAEPAVLHAYLAADLGRELYNSDQAHDGRDRPGAGVKFAVPTVANGRVYVGTKTELAVYGLRSASYLARKRHGVAPPGSAAGPKPGG